ncbi:MAG TPA: hypothetical protein VE130_02415 [Nitrososphaeraceae archaeon]|jgi:hypothetical protein|nr:hypothetical protein [Nitrososphaeraceae archaeon]
MTSKKTSFVDEDWTGLSHEEIKSRIISEFEQEEIIESEAEEIKSVIKETQKNTSSFLLSALSSTLNEQREIGSLDKDEAEYIYQAVKDQANRKGWLKDR